MLISKLKHALGLVILAMALCQSARADVCENDDFKPQAENDPQACRELWQKVGLPVSSDDLDATFVCDSRFALLHNNEAKTPFWVIEPLTKTR